MIEQIMTDTATGLVLTGLGLMAVLIICSVATNNIGRA